jgi:hypothetical protein
VESTRELAENWTIPYEGVRWCRRCGRGVADSASARARHVAFCQEDSDVYEFCELVVDSDYVNALQLLGAEGWSVAAPLVATHMGGLGVGDTYTYALVLQRRLAGDALAQRRVQEAKAKRLAARSTARPAVEAPAPQS